MSSVDLTSFAIASGRHLFQECPTPGASPYSVALKWVLPICCASIQSYEPFSLCEGPCWLGTSPKIKPFKTVNPINNINMCIGFPFGHLFQECPTPGASPYPLALKWVLPICFASIQSYEPFSLSEGPCLLGTSPKKNHLKLWTLIITLTYVLAIHLAIFVG